MAQRVWDSNCLPDVTTATDSWWSANGYTPTPSIGQTSQEPRYVVEMIQRVEPQLGLTPKKFRYYYRTTGWSVGFTDQARGLLQSVYSKKTDDYSIP